MAAHVLKLDWWKNGADSFYVGDINAIGQQGNQWYTPARLLGLSLERYIALLVSVFNANIQGYDGKTLVYCFKNKNDADKFCKYINQKAKSVAFYV